MLTSLTVQESALPITGMMLTFLWIFFITSTSRGFSPCPEKGSMYNQWWYSFLTLEIYHRSIERSHLCSDWSTYEPSFSMRYITCWCNEVKASMNPVVSDIKSLNSGLSFKVSIKLILNIVQNRSPAFCVVNSFSKSWSVNHCQWQFDSIFNQDSKISKIMTTMDTGGNRIFRYSYFTIHL